MKKPKGFKHWSNQDKIFWYEKNISELKTELSLKNKSIESLSYTNDINEVLADVLNLIIDPNNRYYTKSKDEVFKRIEDLMGNKVAVLYNEGVVQNGRNFDGVLENFSIGSKGFLSSWDIEENTTSPLIIRGVGGSSQLAIRHCWKTGRDFYAVDTGYFGNGKHKIWHRITHNNLQHLGPIVERPFDRLKTIGYKFKKFTPGKKILICPPSEKIMQLFDQPSPEEWTKQTVEQLKKFTDRPIEVRLKPIRSERVSNNTIEQALDNNVHCLVTYNSIAATEAIMNGKPAIALGPNSAHVICNSSLSDVENLNIPSQDEVESYMAHLSYCQFNREEMMNGYAWKIVNEGC